MKKYNALRFIAGLYFMFGSFVLLFGSITAFCIVAFTPPLTFAYGIFPNVGETSPINLILAVVIEVGVLVVGIASIGVTQLVDLLLELYKKSDASQMRQNEQMRLMRILVRNEQRRYLKVRKPKQISS